jgi:hypothetical protein
MISTDIWVWLYALFTIACLSYLYKDNPFWKFVESTVIGAATGNMVIMGIQNIQKVGINQISVGSYSLILPLLVGLLFFTRYIKTYTWLARYAVAILIGIGTGISIRTVVGAQIIEQIQVTIIPILVQDPLKTIGNLVMIVLVFGGLLNFVFTTKLENRFVSILRDLGRDGLLISFGSSYAAIVLTYMSSLIGQVQFLLFDWLGLR